MRFTKTATLAFAVLGYAATAHAAAPVANGPDAVFAPSQGVSLPSGQTAPLMGFLDTIGIGKGLEAADIRLYGHVEGSYTYNFEPPARDLNNGRVFDLEHNRPTLNQVDFNVERPVDLSQHRFDIGGHAEMLYGGDSRFIHSNGLLDYDDFFHGPELQLDLPQAYIDVAIPLGEGLRIRVGKFLFFKQIDPNASVFYSHSFSFGSALPYTLTGVTGLYRVNNSLSVEGGVSRGWDQSIRDNNGSPDGLFRIKADVTDRLSLSLAGIVGPELDHDSSHYRETMDFTANFAATDQLTFLLDAIAGTQAQSSGVGTANWYGVSIYAVCQLNDYLALGARGEWYRDEKGFTTALSQTLYEATVGVTFTPFPHAPIASNFKVRPELRGDYSTRPYFDGLTKHQQFTAAVDAIFNF